MPVLIDFDTYPLNVVIDLLLKDKTTKKNIIWATHTYEEHGDEYSDKNQMECYQFCGIYRSIIQPRVSKALEQQQERTKNKAEVFTPSWICNKMNNYCDEQWFGRKDVFNIEIENGWQTVTDKIIFPEKKNWQQYVDSRRLEITCGEAPYLVSGYDATTGEIIPLKDRTGLLDRKMRVINENTTTEDEWIKWTIRAFQSCYGYEYQGDNLLIARTNMFLSFVDYYKDRYNKDADKNLMRKIANIISWNIWQMDGLKGSVPFGSIDKTGEQITFYELIGEKNEEETIECKITDWRKERSFLFHELTNNTRGNHSMKFDFVIGNPPYQEETIGDNKIFAPPVYDKFLDESYKIANAVEMIHPARFLFNAGSTSKQWNKKC
ncbi:MAG: Eco57I restriction-modification methylase domain-containing protein [Acutalibacteraceae bacterium]